MSYSMTDLDPGPTDPGPEPDPGPAKTVE